MRSRILPCSRKTPCLLILFTDLERNSLHEVWPKSCTENSQTGLCWLRAGMGSLDSADSFASERFRFARDDSRKRIKLAMPL
jgi:hypothetical protein